MSEHSPDADVTVFEHGPYVSAAFVCEKILVERDDVPTAIRIIDMVGIRAHGRDAPDTLPAGRLPRHVLFLMLRNGRTRGSHDVAVRIELPSGERRDAQANRVHFAGDEQAATTFIVDLNLDVDQEGLYWFDVLFDGHRLTRVPLKVVYERFAN